MATGDAKGTSSTGDKVVATIEDVTDQIGKLIPTVGAIGNLIRLVATVVRPSDAQQAQAFNAAIAEYDQAKAGLDTAVLGFDAAKAAAAGGSAAAAPKAGKPVGAMGTGSAKPAGGS